jgi:hypothetical protein
MDADYYVDPTSGTKSYAGYDWIDADWSVTYSNGDIVTVGSESWTGVTGSPSSGFEFDISSNNEGVLDNLFTQFNANNTQNLTMHWVDAFPFTEGDFTTPVTFSSFNGVAINSIGPNHSDSNGIVFTLPPAWDTFENQGSVTTANGVNASSGYTVTGTMDIGTGFNATVRVVETYSNGDVLVGGDFTEYKDGTPVNYLVKLKPNGDIDPNWTTPAPIDGPVLSLLTKHFQ